MTNLEKTEEKWTIVRSRYVPALWPIITYFDWPVKDWLKEKSAGEIIHVFNKGHLTAIFNTKERVPLAKKVLDEIKKLNLKELRAKGIASGREVIKDLKVLSKKAKKAEAGEFIGILDSITKIYPKIMRYNMLYWLWASAPLEGEISKKLSNFQETEKTEILQTLSLPTIPSYSKKIDQEFNILVEFARKNSLNDTLNKKIKSFSRKYFWFPYEYVGPGIWDSETLKKKILEEIKNSKKEIFELDVQEKQREVIKKYKLKKELRYLFKILQILTIMQDDRKMFSAHACYYINEVILQNLAKKVKVSREESLYLDQELIGVYLKNKEEFYRRSRARAEFCVIDQIDAYKKIHEGEEAKNFLKVKEIYLEGDNTKVSEFKGLSANKGIYRGKVRILKTSHTDEFQQGEVLVTGMTTPDFAPIIKKAGAIVTDEGGITCHAAIVAREMKKPCIIGTKIATSVLKNGDLVEVDASQGIVRILKSDNL